MKTIALIGLVVTIVAMITLLLRQSLFATGPVTITLQVLAVLLMIWARVTFGFRSFHAGANPTEGGIVSTGPYRFWRHPIYAAIIYFVVVALCCHFSFLNLLLTVIVIGGLAARMLAEETLLVKRYPEYADYAAHTKRVVPFVL